MQVFHARGAVSSAFDDPNLVSSAGLVPVMALAADTGLGGLVDEHVRVPEYYGANAGLKVTALVAGMVAGADCIDDMGVLRHGGTGKLFTGTYATVQRATGDVPPIEFGVDLPDPVYPHPGVGVNAHDVLLEAGVTPRAGADGSILEGVVGPRGDLEPVVLGQDTADRFDSPAVLVLVDEGDDHFCGRSNSALAKKAVAERRISFDRRSSRFSAWSCRI